MFYNTENLFDVYDNPKANDNEFLPEGAMHWTAGRYRNKITNISKVITSLGEWGTPALVGLCEVENDTVMRDLTRNSPLKGRDYRYVISHCQDPRGINVALMYQRDQFSYIKHHTYKVHFPHKKKQRTRDILHVSGRVISGDTLDVFVCHFPSRRAGEKESEPDRVCAASQLRQKTDSLMRVRKNPMILVMGDMNDEPSNKSISETIGAKPPVDKPQRTAMYNLFDRYEKQKNVGSYKYGRQWNMLDQIIVSGCLLDRKQKFHALPESAAIYSASFLLTEDTSNGGKRPKKSYQGRKHEGGYSDHLPVYVDLVIE